ncbi:PTS sugar transporter subunit IIA [Devosia sp. 1635]|uniref:PTS sugar transporter subunit IIA n=1 Tax=Devosia sp. 1635 TaxID=2726066 RepID=UPI001563B6A7|nr:PTS sugar transporter subunit IIA [Devosia sp. 1635]
MNITDFLSPEHIIVGLQSPTKRAVLQSLSSKAAASLSLDPASVLMALEGREMLGSTGVGRGIAIPHTVIPGLSRPFALLAVLDRAVAYEAIDDEPVDIVFLLLMPQEDRSAGLKALAAASRLLRVSACATQIRRATDPKVLYSHIGAFKAQ